MYYNRCTIARCSMKKNKSNLRNTRSSHHLASLLFPYVRTAAAAAFTACTVIPGDAASAAFAAARRTAADIFGSLSGALF